MKWIQSAEFRNFGEFEDTRDVGIRKFTSAECSDVIDVTAFDEESLCVDSKGIGDVEKADRTLEFTISSDVRDRDRDVIKQDGLRKKEFKSNPVVPWMHNYAEPPIGRALAVWSEKGSPSKTKAIKQFTAQDENPFGYMIYQLAKNGYLKGASIGFRIRDYVADKNDPDGLGLLIKRADLLESSIVTIPSNPIALIGAKADHGIDCAPMVAWCEKILDEQKGAGLWVPNKDLLETTRKAAKPDVSTFVIEIDDDDVIEVEG